MSELQSIQIMEAPRCYRSDVWALLKEYPAPSNFSATLLLICPDSGLIHRNIVESFVEKLVYLSDWLFTWRSFAPLLTQALTSTVFSLSIKSAFSDLQFVNSNVLDIVMLRKFWLRPADNFLFPSYFTYLLDRQPKRRGGLLSLILTHLVHSASVVAEIMSDSSEILGVPLCLSRNFGFLLFRAYYFTGFQSIFEIEVSCIPTSKVLCLFWNEASPTYVDSGQQH